MKKYFLLFTLLLLIGIPQEGFAKLNAPSDLTVPKVQERTARVEWSWDSGEEEVGTITDFEIDIGLKRGDNPSTKNIIEKDFPVDSCSKIANWTLFLAGREQTGFTIRGILEKGETYCWKVMARAGNPTHNSDFSPTSEFTTEKNVAVVCPPNCDSAFSSDGAPPTFLGNPISSKTLPQLLENVLNFLFGIAIVILPIIILYGGILLLTAGGNPQKISNSRTILLWAVVAFAIILLARGLPTVLRNLL